MVLKYEVKVFHLVTTRQRLSLFFQKWTLVHGNEKNIFNQERSSIAFLNEVNLRNFYSSTLLFLERVV